MKEYNKLMAFDNYEDRIKYLKTNNVIGNETYGYDRYINQKFYKSIEWKNIREKAIARDLGNDLGLIDYPILGHIVVHHINPITKEDIINGSEKLFDLNNLICVSENTHKIIHYDKGSHKSLSIERKKNDTIPWKK